MKQEVTPPKKRFSVLYRVFLAIIGALVLLLVAGRLYAAIRQPDSAPLFRIGCSRGGGAAAVQGSAEETTAVFTGIGRLRIPVESTNTIIVLTISFPYPANDRPFAEELASRLGEFRSIAIGYFSSLPAEKVSRPDEEAAKAEILKRYNALLRLGKIQTLWFTDFTVL